MTRMDIILATLIVVPLVVLIVLYNRLVKHRNLLREAWSGIDVQLKRRHSLIPNLVEVVETYAGHERDTLEAVTRERTRSQSVGSIDDVESAEMDLSAALRSVLVLVEDYPDLRADTRFAQLQDELVDTENQIEMARRYYNGTTRNYNILVESFPSNLVARVGGFASRDYFEIEIATERVAPAVSLGGES